MAAGAGSGTPPAGTTLRERELRLVIYAATFALTVAFGALEVAYPGFASERATDAWGPTLIATLDRQRAPAVAAACTSLTPIRQLPRLMALLAIPVVLHLAVDGPWTMAPLAFVAGILIAPSMTDTTLLVSRHAASGVHHGSVHVVGDGDRHRRGRRHGGRRCACPGVSARRAPRAGDGQCACRRAARPRWGSRPDHARTRALNDDRWRRHDVARHDARESQCGCRDRRTCWALPSNRYRRRARTKS